MIVRSRKILCHEMNKSLGFKVPAAQVLPCFGVGQARLSVCLQPHKPTTSCRGYGWRLANKYYPKKKHHQTTTTTHTKPKQTCWLQLRLLKITSSQTFISKVEFHVKWKYLLKPYVHVCMIQTTTTVQHISLNFNKCTLTFSSKRNINGDTTFALIFSHEITKYLV